MTPICGFCDLDLDPMTLIYEHNVDIPKMYQQPKVNVPDEGIRNYEPEQVTQTRFFARATLTLIR